MCIIVVDALHADQPIVDKDDFYEKPSDLIQTENRGSTMVMVAEDFNARVGKPQSVEEERVIGKHGFENPAEFASEKMAGNRYMFTNLCTSTGMVTEGHPRQKVTEYPKEDTNNLIIFWLTGGKQTQLKTHAQTLI